MNTEEKIVAFCNSVKKGFGTIVDTIVKTEYERVNECKIQNADLAALLRLVEKHNLLDKKRCINSSPDFYQVMYKKINEKKHVQ